MSDYKIYPAIGVARVGNAPDKFYIGPEVYRGLPTNPNGKKFTEADFRDRQGRLCRQAARFRIYRQTADGREEELTLATPGVKSITWTVHLANKKASWYEFKTNEGANGYASNHPLRNASVANRQSLIIDAGPRSIVGANAGPVPFDKASVPAGYQGANFPPGPLQPTGESITTLGELRTDRRGRLLVLGGMGISGTRDPKPVIKEYANNDGWWDDTSDGSVSALVEMADGAGVTADAALVVVGPPAYAPQIPNVVTLWDTIFDTAVRSGHYPDIFENEMWKGSEHGYHPSFASEIQPLLERPGLDTWVARMPIKRHTFDWKQLGTVPVPGKVDKYLDLRNRILGVVRAPSEENKIESSGGATMMPYLAGDNCLIRDTLTSKYLRLTDTQYFFLQQWAAGWFKDGPGRANSPTSLTRGVLENCVGGAFSPGIEMGWISRHPAIYRPDDPFRINSALKLSGPLNLGFNPRAMEPGDTTRYMAIPWQADFNECSSQPIGTRRLWWWPAQRPEFIHLAQLKNQVPWVGSANEKRNDFIQFAEDIQMVKYWDGLGFVMERDGRYVEVARTLPRPFRPK